MTPSINNRTCLHPSTPTAIMLSNLFTFPPNWTLESIISTETLSSLSPIAPPPTVARLRNDNSCSSAPFKSKIGSGFTSRSSAGEMIPLVTADRIDGMGTPASTKAILAAFRHAAKMAPSELKTCRLIEIVDRG